MARRFLALNWKEYASTPLDRARFFGVLPLTEPLSEGLRVENYLWGKVLVLSRRGREVYFAYKGYVPSSEAARTALLRYAFAKVMEKQGYTLKGRLGEVLVFEAPTERKAFLAVKWGGYTPAGIRRIYESVGKYLHQAGGILWFLPAPKRRFGRFLKAHPVVEVIPEGLAKEALGAFEAYAQGREPSLVALG